MPAGATAGRRPPPDFVVGDANGSACALPLIRAAEAFLRGRNFLVTRNDPYAGGYVTRHYGRPREAVHALQIEVARGLYMDEATLVRRAGFARLQRDLTEWIECLTEAARGLAMEL
jgi:N-formylglutamate deformylase